MTPADARAVADATAEAMAARLELAVERRIAPVEASIRVLEHRADASSLWTRIGGTALAGAIGALFVARI